MFIINQITQPPPPSLEACGGHFHQPDAGKPIRKLVLSAPSSLQPTVSLPRFHRRRCPAQLPMPPFHRARALKLLYISNLVAAQSTAAIIDPSGSVVSSSS
ncbi:hypothetical protein M0R45_013772 [Rubus argutus]|uniref:Uncharacterized protein n=1 Tax=Rubus argutus TaxID=59490 RepID=A0AAW1XJG6_RUBAR